MKTTHFLIAIFGTLLSLTAQAADGIGYTCFDILAHGSREPARIEVDLVVNHLPMSENDSIMASAAVRKYNSDSNLIESFKDARGVLVKKETREFTYDQWTVRDSASGQQLKIKSRGRLQRAIAGGKRYECETRALRKLAP